MHVPSAIGARESTLQQRCGVGQGETPGGGRFWRCSSVGLVLFGTPPEREVQDGTGQVGCGLDVQGRRASGTAAWGVPLLRVNAGRGYHLLSVGFCSPMLSRGGKNAVPGRSLH